MSGPELFTVYINNTTTRNDTTIIIKNSMFGEKVDSYSDTRSRNVGNVGFVSLKNVRKLLKLQLTLQLRIEI